MKQLTILKGRGYENTEENFLVMTEYDYGKTIYRGMSLEGQYLSDAWGESVEELKNAIQGIEQVEIYEIKTVKLKKFTK